MPPKEPVPVEPTSIMNTIMEYAKNPSYIMMFLGVLFLGVIGFMMYKKPDMLQKLMKPTSTQETNYTNESMNDEEGHEIPQSVGADL